MTTSQLIDRYQTARKDQSLAVIEGIQALKHAARFQAELENIVTSDKASLSSLLTQLAADVKSIILDKVEEVDASTFARLSPQPPRTSVIALAQRKSYTLESIGPKRSVVVLEDPRDLENIGAVIRVCAAADCAAVCITGSLDIWHPAIIRGAVALHYALPVLTIKTLSNLHSLKRPLVALDPGGEPIPNDVKQNSIFIFGTERQGLSKATLQHVDTVVSLPMKPGVSSLNLATSVAATLYRLN